MEIIHTKCSEEFEIFPIFGGLETMLYCRKCGESYNGRNGITINKSTNVLRNDGSLKYFHYISRT